MEEENLKKLKLNNFERVPLDQLVKQQSPNPRHSPSASTAVTRSVKSGIRSTKSGIK